MTNQGLNIDFKAKGVTSVAQAIQFAAQTKDLEVTLYTHGGSFLGTIAQADNSVIILQSKADVQASYEKYIYSFVSPSAVTGVVFVLKENKK